MTQPLLIRFTLRERLVHWVHMITFLILALTGIGLYARSFFQITWFFGGVDISRTIHHWAGIMFAATTVLVFLQWRRDIRARGEDNLVTVLRGFLDSEAEVAPAGKFNAGQKIAGWATLVLGGIFTVTGLAMWFPFLLGRWVQQWMYFLHSLTFLVFVGFMMLHAYLGTVGVPGTWRGMYRGTVTRAWARRNHPRWDAEEVRVHGTGD